MKKTAFIIIASICILMAAIPTKAASITFLDVSPNHWAYEAISIATNEGIIRGYPDNTFRPEQPVTEAEFIVMFIRAFEDIQLTKMPKHWADPYYDFAIKKNWPVKGAEYNSIDRDTPISRTSVAEIIATADGQDIYKEEAIQYLLDKGYSHGKSSPTVEGYKGDDTLTRAEAVQFIKNVKVNGLVELKQISIPDEQFEQNDLSNSQDQTPIEFDYTLDEIIIEDSPDYVGKNMLNIAYEAALRGEYVYGPSQSFLLMSNDEQEVKKFVGNLINGGIPLNEGHIEIALQVIETKELYVEKFENENRLLFIASVEGYDTALFRWIAPMATDSTLRQDIEFIQDFFK